MTQEDIIKAAEEFETSHTELLGVVTSNIQRMRRTAFVMGANYASRDRWHKVEDRLPRPDTNVVFTLKNKPKMPISGCFDVWESDRYNHTESAQFVGEYNEEGKLTTHEIEDVLAWVYPEDIVPTFEGYEE